MDLKTLRSTQKFHSSLTDKFNVMISSPVDSEVELEIFGLKGERHLTTKAQSNMVVEIDAQNYTPGVYILKAQQMMRKKSIKLIKE
jgi:hypothetical protein